MGSISVKNHLAPYLPGNPVVRTGGEKECSAVSSAPWGAAMIDAISYGYILALGVQGLTRATQYAILNANYLKARLEKHFDILYSGPNGRTAHELIVDLRPIKEKYGVTAGDVSKRLMDYGFHAPTVSFPVHETLMVEPTESESERTGSFAVRDPPNLEKSARSRDPQNNLLVNAPHPLYAVTADAWDRPYTRSEAAYPLPWVEANKYFTPVGRVDDGFGDRNLVCVWPE